MSRIGKPLKCFPSIRVGQIIKTKVLRLPEEPPVQLAKVRVQKMNLDKNLLMYFPGKRDKWCLDKLDTRIGDIVVCKNLDQRFSKQVYSQIDSIMYKVGVTVDPLTGRKCRGTDFIDDEPPQKRPAKPVTGGSKLKESKKTDRKPGSDSQSMNNLSQLKQSDLESVDSQLKDIQISDSKVKESERQQEVVLENKDKGGKDTNKTEV